MLTSAVGTGTVTQILVDMTARWRPHPETDLHVIRECFVHFGANFAAFMAGGALAAVRDLWLGMGAVLVPPPVAAAEIFTRPPEAPTGSGARPR
ncbi:hypothetical protein V5F53_12250 [Xanthobacter sp. V4C-4]|uniref:hypothetical protein n=1 Tax=Xanthobacter cornucopiae TaxID=3119924 RepID=UPI0037288EB3